MHCGSDPCFTKSIRILPTIPRIMSSTHTTKVCTRRAPSSFFATTRKPQLVTMLFFFHKSTASTTEVGPHRSSIRIKSISCGCRCTLPPSASTAWWVEMSQLICEERDPGAVEAPEAVSASGYVH